MKNKKLHISFHNPNTQEETAKFLTKFAAAVAVENSFNLNYEECYNSQDNNLTLISKKNGL